MGYRKNYNTVSWKSKLGVRHVASMGNDLLTSILEYEQSICEEANKIAQDIQAEMKKRVESETPIRHYSTHTQVIHRITANRHPPNTPKAVREKVPDKYQPGATKSSWKFLTTSNLLGEKTTKLTQSRIGHEIRTDEKPITVYAVRNTTRWSIIHLLNFDHDHVAHGARVENGTKGTYFVTEVQNWGRKELDRKLSEMLKQEENNG